MTAGLAAGLAAGECIGISVAQPRLSELAGTREKRSGNQELGHLIINACIYAWTVAKCSDNRSSDINHGFTVASNSLCFYETAGIHDKRDKCIRRD